MDIRIELTKTPKAKPADESKLGFGRVFTDHMFVMDWYKGKGWEDARIIPFGNLSVHPASTVFHYAVEIFEGLKAYRAADGSIRLFRPIENARRMNNSAIRMAMPTIPEEDIVQAIETLVTLDKDWVPHEDGTSLYIRPFMIGDDEHLGVHGISHARFMIILSPSGAYYPEGMAPVKIMIEDEDVRAVRGGTGFTKCGGNYAGSIAGQVKAEQMGYSQVLWLDGNERKYVEEVGTMNIMFKIDGEIWTAPIEGTVLPGITRDSMIHLLRDWGYTVREERLAIDDLMAAAREGKLEEVFGTGTAAVISPVGELRYKDEVAQINGGQTGELTQKLYDTLTGIQWGKLEDKYGWTQVVD